MDRAIRQDRRCGWRAASHFEIDQLQRLTKLLSVPPSRVLLYLHRHMQHRLPFHGAQAGGLSPICRLGSITAGWFRRPHPAVQDRRRRRRLVSAAPRYGGRHACSGSPVSAATCRQLAWPGPYSCDSRPADRRRLIALFRGERAVAGGTGIANINLSRVPISLARRGISAVAGSLAMAASSQAPPVISGIARLSDFHYTGRLGRD
jgi:hypothetical protein